MLGLIKRILRRRRLAKIKDYYSAKKSTILLPSFSIRLDNPSTKRQYLTIGDNCIIGGTFVFESEEGEIQIGDNTYIGNSMFISRSSIKIGSNVTIAWGCTVYNHDSHSVDYLNRRKDIKDQYDCLVSGCSMVKSKNWTNVRTKPIIIKDDAWIGMNVVILKGVTIGEGAIVGAGSVVTKDVPDWSIVAGNPARIVKKIDIPKKC